MQNSAEIIELWNAFRKGNKEAFNTIALNFYQTLYNYGTKFTSDFALVEDCIQDLFLELWRRREFIEESPYVHFYLLKSLRRKIFEKQNNYIKRREQSVEHFDGLDFIGEFSIETEIIEAESNEYHLRRLQETIARLSKRQREAIYLKFYQGLKNEQIAAIMSINYQSVRNLLHTAIKDLQNTWFSNSRKKT